ncbi:winged helix-turn-helix domain-containing protein [Shewanella avicenniae]|uniref:Winged helix-turn-helix domain-containing protein n=1 Tax=Shewanella avicenniae TaxID=2814294 RepID=A0ABX7QS77_9GAMM|nr:winged helix-turn-helix domain-containing protein [Shewanella avicenniae]QSX34254.1 winged helix-turn-helix domain-containing protein [Shewanella avicenniae]
MWQAEQVTKQQIAFLRKLYLAHLIDDGQHNLLSLQKLTGMPRRTVQDALAACSDIGIQIAFVQDGVRNNSGYYHIQTWGPINSAWVGTHLSQIELLLQIPAAPSS